MTGKDCTARIRSSVAKPSILGQSDVEHDEIGWLVGDQFQRLLATRDRADFEALQFEALAYHGGERPIVFDQQKSG